MLEVILTNEILKLGAKGDVVRVAPGYARNYLYPKQLAIPATAANKAQISQMRAAADREADALRGDAEKIEEALSGLTIRIVARAGETDQLFGSVTSRDIADELEKLGYAVDRHKILVDKPIRVVGEHSVKVHLHRDINVPMTVLVLAEGREHEMDEPDTDFEEMAADSEESRVESSEPNDETPVEALVVEHAETESVFESEAERDVSTGQSNEDQAGK